MTNTKTKPLQTVHIINCLHIIIYIFFHELNNNSWSVSQHMTWHTECTALEDRSNDQLTKTFLNFLNDWFKQLQKAVKSRCYNDEKSSERRECWACYSSILSTSSRCCIFLSANLRPTQRLSRDARSFDQTMWSFRANTWAACIAAASADITVTQPRPRNKTQTYRHTYRYTDRQTDTDRVTDTDRQTDRQTHRYKQT